MTDFEEMRILDNFYQTSSFFPMPVVLVGTLSESGQTNLGPYSLCFPHIIAEDNEWAMMLITRKDSNTAENIRRTKVCSLNFISDDPKYMENCVQLGFPGETTEEKMKDSIFTLVPSKRRGNGMNYPDLVQEAIQVFECTWDDSFEHKLIEPSDNFVLRIEKILLKKQYRDAIVQGVDKKSFPQLPIDYGFRDNYQFWFTKSSKPYSVPIPESKGVGANHVLFAARRIDPDIRWEEAAAAKIAGVPRIFLNKVIKGVIEAAKAEGVVVITPEFMDKVRDKRSQEKGS